MQRGAKPKPPPGESGAALLRHWCRPAYHYSGDEPARTKAEQEAVATEEVINPDRKRTALTVLVPCKLPGDSMFGRSLGSRERKLPGTLHRLLA